MDIVTCCDFGHEVQLGTLVLIFELSEFCLCSLCPPLEVCSGEMFSKREKCVGQETWRIRFRGISIVLEQLLSTEKTTLQWIKICGVVTCNPQITDHFPDDSDFLLKEHAGDCWPWEGPFLNERVSSRPFAQNTTGLH